MTQRAKVCENSSARAFFAAKIGHRHLDIRRVVFVLAAGIIIASCSKESESDKQSETKRESESLVAREDDESQPHEEEIEEHCVAFVRSTKVVSGQKPTAGCSECPRAGAEVLSFRQMKTDRISCSADTCSVLVTIRASFNPGAGETIAGGLTAWISPEQRNAYLAGQTPSGEQTYRVQITYKRRGDGWRAIEFDRASGE